MGIRKPNMSVTEARRLAGIRAEAFPPPAEPPLPEPSQPADPPSETSPLAAPLRPAASPVEAAPLPNPPATLPGKTTPTPAPDAPAPAAPIERRSAPQGAAPRSVRAPVVAPPLPSSRQDEVEKAQIYLSAPYPEPGLSPTFELVCRHYPRQKALQMILRRALQDYDTLLESGEFQGIAKTYPIDEREWPAPSVQTSRMMEKPLLALARAHFDPLGLESTRAFGRKLATAALAAFFAHEPKRPV